MKTMPRNQMSRKTGTRLLIDKLESSKSFLFRQAWIMILIKLKRKVIAFYKKAPPSAIWSSIAMSIVLKLVIT